MSDRVPTRFVITLLRMVGERGYDFSYILRDAGLDFDPLDPRDPAYRNEISAMQYSRIYQSVLSLLQDETFGTTGPMITLRLFAGWDFNNADLGAADAASRGYARGVPMGGTLEAAANGEGAPASPPGGGMGGTFTTAKAVFSSSSSSSKSSAMMIEGSSLKVSLTSSAGASRSSPTAGVP